MMSEKLIRILSEHANATVTDVDGNEILGVKWMMQDRKGLLGWGPLRSRGVLSETGSRMVLVLNP